MGNPCINCGACCASFRVVLPASETSDQPGGFVPVELTELLGNRQRVMRGTCGGLQKRCAALEGTVGLRVSCRVYDQRPSTCRNFRSGWESGVSGNASCDRARALYGLMPFDCY